ncbi:sensor histidine kinase [Georgenia sp. Z1344]|uniref:sensor histidine kinase n=1 Tax=Georgenia sp. Z1344 TaxID=3416706 RepID=UPI003CF08995
MTGRTPSHDPVGNLLALRSPRTGWTWLATIYTAVVLVPITWPVLTNVHDVHVAISMVLAFATSGALVLAVRWPAVSLGLALAGAVGTAAAAASSSAPWPWPVPTMIAFLLNLLVLTLLHGWRWGAGLWLGGSALSVVAVLLRPDAGGAVANAIVTAGIGAGLLAAGSGLRLLLRGRTALTEERRARAEESERRTELQERNRIAQEMHDVVAHSMSVISVQATTAPFRLSDTSPEVDAEFASIAQSSRSALTEMRGLLSILRGTEDADLAPQPSLTDVAELVDGARSSGATITFDHRGAGPETVPPATGLTAYRIVQEGLSNALRHAPGAEVAVTLAVGADEVGVAVVNGPATGEVTASAGAGLGLAGIRDRTRALGGTSDIGPTPEGGFAVTATLPVG